MYKRIIINKKHVIAILVVILVICAAILPNHGGMQSKNIIHQHKLMPGPSEKTVGVDEHGVLSSNLPLIIINTKGQTIPGRKRIDKSQLICDYKIIDNKNGVNYSNDIPTESGDLAISIRGMSSRLYEKNQYSIKLKNEKGLSEKKSLLGMPKESTWVLNGSNIDHSQLRNYMLYNISSEIMPYAPQCRLCEVMFTDELGKTTYRGMYTLIEKPKVSANRLNLLPYDKRYRESSFLLNMNDPVEGIEIPHLKADNRSVYSCELVYPREKNLTSQTLDYINTEFIKAEKSLYDAEYTGDWSDVSKYIDIDSFVDYYIINEFFQNYDAGRKSTYLYSNLGGKLTIGPVWDFDGAFNNYVENKFQVETVRTKETYYYVFLTKNPEFIDKLESRYKELRRTFLSDEYLLEYIDSSYTYAGDAIMRNCDRWYEGNQSVVKEDVEKMKTFVKERGKWLDENLVRQSRELN